MLKGVSFIKKDPVSDPVPLFFYMRDASKSPARKEKLSSS
jgi:hypothetical protein